MIGPSLYTHTHTHTHTTAYGPPKGGSSSYLSPVDSAIGSGVTSGVTTKAHSVVGGDDLEKFEDEEQLPPAYPYQSYSEQQSRGEGGAGQSNILGMPTMMHALKMSIRLRRCVCTVTMENKDTWLLETGFFPVHVTGFGNQISFN